MEKLLAREDIDIVVNLTPPQNHYDIIKAALTAGKHVFTEKPLATTAADGANVDLPDGVLDMAEVVRCAPNATDYTLEQSSFSGTIAESLKRNAEFLKKL